MPVDTGLRRGTFVAAETAVVGIRLEIGTRTRTRAGAQSLFTGTDPIEAL